MKRLTDNILASLPKVIVLTAMAVIVALGMSAQEPDKRHVTPVKPETNRVQPPPKGTDEKIIQQYISGDSAAAVAEARKDSLRRVYYHYPLLTDIAVGVNLAEPMFMAFGQSYASADVNVTLNMWNRLQPTAEVGLGWAKSSADDLNFTYTGKPSPYFKVGVSPFTYDITEARYVNSYWQEYLTFDIRGEHSHALWGEAGAGLKVKLSGPWSLGWMIRYHGIFNYGKNEHSRPWFIPGYGPRNSSLGFSLSLYYTLPLHRGSNTDKP